LNSFEPTREDLTTALRGLVRQCQAERWPRTSEQLTVLGYARRVLTAQDAADAAESNGITEAEITVALPPENPGGRSADHDGIFGSVTWKYLGVNLTVWLNGKHLNWQVMSRPAFFRLLDALGIEGGAA
jgi:hypothetical protein